MTISPIVIIIALLGAASLGAILCALAYTLRELSKVSYELSTLKVARVKSNVCKPKVESMHYVEKYMTDHQFPEDDKKKVRDFLSQKQFEHAFLTDENLHYIRGSSECIVSRSILGLQDNFV